MKKVMMLVLVGLIGIIVFPRKVNAYTESTNILDPSKVNLEFIGFQNEFGDECSKIKITGTGFIDVEPEVEYFILPPFLGQESAPGFGWYCAPLIEEGTAKIGTYDGYDEALDQLTLHKKLIYSPGILVGYAVTFSDDVRKIKIDSISLVTDSWEVSDMEYFYENDFGNRIDHLLMIIKADDLKKLPNQTTYVYEYSSGDSYDVTNLYFGEDESLYEYGILYNDIKSPIIETNRYLFTTYVDNPVTIEDLMAEIELSAEDEIDGDLTSQITYNAIDYEENVLNVLNTKERLLGTYDVTFSVSDDSGNSASCVISIEVVDNQKPTVNYDDSVFTYTISIEEEKLTLEDVLNNIHVSDNYSEVTSTVLNNNYHEALKDLGKYEIEIKYTDESYNEITLKVTINVIDDVAPTISLDSLEYDISYKDYKSITEILSILNIVVSDNYDEDITYQIASNNYLGNENKIGNYEVTVIALDSSNNRTEKVLNIKVIDDVDPIFYLNDTKVSVSAKDLLDMVKIKEILVERKLVRNDNYDVEIIYDEYSENASQTGTYDLRLKISYEDGTKQYEKFTIEVINDSETKHPNFFSKVWGVILTILLFIWNIIKWPFVQLFRLFS